MRETDRHPRPPEGVPDWRELDRPGVESRAAMREARRGGLPSVKDVPSLLTELNAAADEGKESP